MFVISKKRISDDEEIAGEKGALKMGGVGKLRFTKLKQPMTSGFQKQE